MKTINWENIARLVLQSQAIDDKEERELVPAEEVLYQFSARGHELGQILLGLNLTHKHDGISAYYRSRPLMLSLGVSSEDTIAASMAKSGGYSDGRDIGVVCNKQGKNGPVVFPVAGDVGSQYTPAIGWAQGIEYRRLQLENKEYERAIAVILGGDGSVATNGFWSALAIATTQNLPVLFYIEDNSYGISVPSTFQTPGGNIAKNLYAFKNIRIFDGDGTNPEEAYELIEKSVNYTRDRNGPALIHLMMPRLNGHSYQDNQAYKSEELVRQEQKRDPLKKLKEYIINGNFTENEWNELEKKVRDEVDKATNQARNRPEPDSSTTEKYVFAEFDSEGKQEIQQVGGLATEGIRFPAFTTEIDSDSRRMNMVEAIRQTLKIELDLNPRLVVFGEDVGVKGGVYGATIGLQPAFGKSRVFDTSLSEDGIIGRAVGMAYNGLMPVAEIQFRKYADSATEQLNNCGTIRWRTANKFAAPMVVRMAGGFAKCGDPWHSISNEAFFAHAIGWQLVYPANARDAAGLLRSAMRSNNPTIFFEHRHLLDARYARKPYPGDQYIVPIGKANYLQEGNQLTVVTWGAMCERCEAAAAQTGINADILDLRSIMPWDKKAVIKSLKKTSRCLIVHEDAKTVGLGAEISATLAKEAFNFLDAPIERLAMPDIPLPYNAGLMNAVLPGTASIAHSMEQLINY